MSDKSLRANGKSIPLLPKNPSVFLDKMTTVYGASQTGKTYLVNDIVHKLAKVVATVYVFGSAGIETSYENIHPNAIYSDITIDGFKAILNRQKEVALLYKDAHNNKTMYKLFLKVATQEERSRLNKKNLMHESLIKKIEKLRVPYADKASKIHKIKVLRDKTQLGYYHKVLKLHRKHSKLSTLDKTIIQYIDVNPHALIIMDDCVSILKKFAKEEALIKTAFEGRHSYITSIFTMQNITMMPKELRQNSMVLMYTTLSASNMFFNNVTAGQKHNHKNAIEHANIVFNKRESNYRKMVFIPEENQFFYTLADVHPPFTVGSKYYREFLDSIPEKKRVISKKYMYKGR